MPWRAARARISSSTSVYCRLTKCTPATRSSGSSCSSVNERRALPVWPTPPCHESPTLGPGPRASRRRFHAAAKVQRQRAHRHLVVGPRLQVVDPVVRHRAQPRRHGAQGKRARKKRSQLVIAFDRHVPRASHQLADTRAVHDLVAEPLLGIDEDRLAGERLALPLGERELAVAADKIFLAPAQLEALPAFFEMPVTQPQNRQAVADVDVLRRRLQRGAQEALGLGFLAGQVLQDALGCQDERLVRLTRERLLNAGESLRIAHLVAEHLCQIAQQRDAFGARLQALPEAPLRLLDLVLVAQSLADHLQRLRALRL